MFNVNTTRPLIPRKQTYVLNRELVTVHSEDRDIKKWKNTNHFEVELPKIMENVESMRLIDCTLPSCHRTFTNDYQNTKMSFTMSVGVNDPIYPTFASVNGEPFTITIQEGFYCPTEMAKEIENKMNQIITDYLVNYGELTPYTYFKVYYDKVGLRYWFGNEVHKFSLLFDKKENYKLTNCKQPEMWEKYVKWGLPFYLGFEKQTYYGMPFLDSNNKPKAISFCYLGSNAKWLEPKTTTTVNNDTTSSSTSNVSVSMQGSSLLNALTSKSSGVSYNGGGISQITDNSQSQTIALENPVYFVKASNSPDLLGEKVIYMEIKKYNNYNEIMPYSENTNSLLHNDYSGRVNSCFAKIPITALPLGEYSESRNGFLNNVKAFDVPEEKISKLLVTFRFHDGRLVEFENGSLNFTVAFNCLKNEIQKSYEVRVPNAYSL